MSVLSLSYFKKVMSL